MKNHIKQGPQIFETEYLKVYLTSSKEKHKQYICLQMFDILNEKMASSLPTSWPPVS